MYVSTHVYDFPVNAIIAWIINDYHEQGNTIIINLLLPLGRISNKYPNDGGNTQGVCRRPSWAMFGNSSVGLWSSIGDSLNIDG